MEEETKNQGPSEETEQSVPEPASTEIVGTAPSRSRRPSFGGLRRQLTNEELQSPGIPKLLLDMLEEAETSRDEYKSYVDAYHAADKRAEVLGEKVNRDTAINIFFGVGVGLGGSIVGLSPFFWEKGALYGSICLLIGIGLIIGATFGRIVKQ